MSSRQICALLAGLVGLGAIIGATVSNEWKSTSRASSVITATWVFQGLWMSCGGNAIGAVHCRPHLTIFKRAAPSYIYSAKRTDTLPPSPIPDRESRKSRTPSRSSGRSYSTNSYV